mgnify:CR=1 FL=1
MRTSFIVCLAFLAIAAGLTACGKSASVPPAAAADQPAPAATAAPADTATPVDGDWLVERLSDEPAHLNPITSSDFYARTVYSSIFESLIERDNQTLELKPLLAERWEVSDDHLSYTFHLQKDVTFSDGVPLTAKDVKFTFDKLMDPSVDAAQLRNYYQDVTKCEVTDDYTVRFTCSKPYFKHLTMLGGLEIIPEHIYSQGDFNSSEYNRKPLGSGPFKFEKWETGSQIVLARNENYWKEKPHYLKYVFKIITDNNAAFELLARQEMDFYSNISPELSMNQAQRPEFQNNFSMYKYYFPGYRYIGWNMRKPQFEDKLVRRALTMLFDKKLVLDTIFYGKGKEVVSDFFIESPEYDKSIQPWPYDPVEAQRLLDEAGWKDTNGDGIRDKGGVEFEFEMLIRAGMPEFDAMATFYQEALKRVGIKMNIRSLEWATFLSRVDERNFDSVILAWTSPAIEGDPYQVWHSSQIPKGSNYVAFNNPEADKLMEEARLEFDEQKRIEMYHRFDAILHEEQPYTFLYCSQWTDALSKRFHGVIEYDFGVDLRKAWVPKELQRY